jgi:hypothetical protein
MPNKHVPDPRRCIIRDLSSGTYGKWPKHKDGDFMVIFEYKTIITDEAIYQGKHYNNWDFVQWVLENPDLLYGFAGGVPYLLPEPR